jgi:ribonuclease III
MIDVRTYQEFIGYEFKNIELLEQAFVHRSYVNENPKLRFGHNERLEFLGDAVLELVATNFLYAKYPEKDEGDLTAYRAALVNAVLMGDIARDIGMNEYLMLSKGESRDTGRARSIILADTFEAVIGAVYLDGGYEPAKEFIHKTILIHTDEVIRKGLFKDAKSMVQEKAQEESGVTPAYRVIKEMGPDHDKRFNIGIYFGDHMVAEGAGKSKQEAEQTAAQNALIKKNWIKSL